MRKPHAPQVHSLSCTACGTSKDNIFLELCPECEQAMLRHFPKDFFKNTKKPTKVEAQDETLQAIKILEALELAVSEGAAPMQQAA